MKILLVEDVRTEATQLSAKLKKLGHEVILAENGQVAFDLFIKTAPDLILMDIMMPVMNGFESTSRIRSYETNNKIPWTPILILSASDTQDNLVIAIESGADDFIAKSAEKPVLQAKIKAMIRIAEINKELQHSRAKYQNLFEHMSNGFALHKIIFDEQGIPSNYRFLEVNPAFERLTGLNKEYVIGRTILEVLPETAKYIIANYGSGIKSDEHRTFEYYSRRIGRWFKALAYNPEHDKLAVTIEDITVRKQAEAALVESELRFRGAFQTAAHGMALVSTQGRFIKVNAALCSMLGYSEAELLVTDFQSITHHDDLAADLGYVNDLLSGKVGSYQMEKRFFHKNSKDIWALLSVSLVRSTEGNPVHFVSQIQDITQSKLNQQRLHELLIEQKAMLENDLIGIVKAKNRVITWANPAFEKMLGYATGELAGMPTRQNYTSEAAYQAFGTAAYSVLAEGGVFRSQIEHKRKDGKLIWVDLSGAILNADTGESLWGFVDITERKHIENALRESEDKLRGLFELSPLGIALTDMNGRYVEFNDSFVRICGYSEHELKSLNYQTLTPIKYQAEEVRQLDILTKTGHYGPYEKEFLRKDGLLIPLCLNGMLVTGNDNQKYIWSIIEDITDRKAAENALSESHQKMHSLLNSMAEGAYGIDINGNCTFVNRSFLRILGYDSAEELIGKDFHTLIHHSYSDGLPLQATECKMCIAYLNHQEIHASDEVFWKKNGSTIPVEYWSQPIRVDDLFQGTIVTFVDITERKMAEAQIHNLAFYDTLTRLPNRRLLNDRLSQTLASSKRSKLYGALMFLDLDNFKPLNDTYGHGVGDLLLIEVARRLSSCIRETDTVARFGGDEFVVMLKELHENQAESVAQTSIIAEKVRATLSQPYSLTIRQIGKTDGLVEHHCTASIGAVIFNYKVHRENILKWADMAMYQAKESGRNCVQVNPPGNFDVSQVCQSDMILGLIWHDYDECGETTIDQQHRELFDLADKLIESAFVRDENPQQFALALNNLLAHIVQHFVDEEAALALHHYANLEEHAKAHRVLIEHALKLRDAAALGGLSLGEIVNFFANEVIAQHMLKEDRKYYSLFKDRFS